MCVLTLILNTEMTMQNSEQTTSVESSLQKKKFLNTNKPLETFARNSPFARGIPPNRKKTKNGNEISKTMAKSWIKSPNGC